MAVGAVYTDAGEPVDGVKLIDGDEIRGPDPAQVLARVTLFPTHWAICRPSNSLR
jgi:hypothetical protein